MKTFPKLATACALAGLVGCAAQQSWYAVGGSRADGTVRLAFTASEFANANPNPAQGVALATQRCRAWGYNAAEAFGGVVRQCNGTQGMFSGCGEYVYYAEYQCLTQSDVPSTIPAASAFSEASEQPAAPVPTPTPMSAPSSGYAPKPKESPKNEYTAGKLARTLGCGVPALLSMSTTEETYQTACPGGQSKIIQCEFTNCRVMQ